MNDRIPSRVLARDEPCADPARCDIHGHGGPSVADTPRTITLTVDPLLSGLYVLQRDFQARLLGALPHELSNREKMEYLREQALALTDELHEALAETGWKSWATSMHINRDAYMGELADVMIFLMNLMLVAEVTPAELLGVVQAKIKKNHARQDNGYDGVSEKCPLCKRAFDDDAVKCAPADNNGLSWCERAGRSFR